MIDKYAAYNDQGIFGTGNTADEAMRDAIDNAGPLTPDEVREQFTDLRTGEMTDRLAARVERYGFDCKHDSYTITDGGLLDVDVPDE